MAAKKSTARKATSKKAAPAKGAGSATKTAAKKSPAKAAKTSATKQATTKKATTKKATTKATSKKTASKKTATKTAGRSVPAASLAVREDESPWTAAELKEVRAELEQEIALLRADLSSSETELTAFLKEPIDGAGDDQADAGAKSFEREHELSLVAGARAGLEQNLHALERLEDGTYGICESCGNPIGKLRLQAYPRATLCMSCKSTQERR